MRVALIFMIAIVLAGVGCERLEVGQPPRSTQETLAREAKVSMDQAGLAGLALLQVSCRSGSEAPSARAVRVETVAVAPTQTLRNTPIARSDLHSVTPPISPSPTALALPTPTTPVAVRPTVDVEISAEARE